MTRSKKSTATPKPKKNWDRDGKLKVAIRKVWRFSPHRKACLDAAYNKETDDWTCAICKKRTERISADHIIPVGLAKTWDVFIKMMFEGVLQALCKPCHKGKSKYDNKVIKESRE